ncbi:hypothetical protein SNE40_012243 [Patella caerulea]|uniref:Uncharacterized protein n=1 Tax=Patella caerulea TaxID=87958 RepID=A0AAN8JR46_PATCE
MEKFKLFYSVISCYLTHVWLTTAISEIFVANYAGYNKHRVLQRFESYETLTAHSVIECARICSKDDRCFSINYLETVSECQLNHGIVVEDFSNSDISQNGIYFERTNKNECQHGGFMNGNNTSCDCVDGYTGNRCQRLIHDCMDGASLSYYAGVRAIVYIYPNTAPSPFQITCRFQWGGRNIIMEHFDRDFTFNRTWQEYKEGFNNSRANRWIGLDNIYYMTQAGLTGLHIEIKTTNPSQLLSSGFKNFQITNETENYKILGIVERYNNFPVCMPQLIGAEFSTYDAIHHNSSVNCAAAYGSGWWFNGDCTSCNINGRLNEPGNGSVPIHEVFVDGYAGRIVGVKMWLV